MEQQMKESSNKLPELKQLFDEEGDDGRRLQRRTEKRG